MGELVNASKAKEIVKNNGCNMGGDVAEALSKKAEQLLKDGCKRATSRGFKTVRGGDL